MARAKVLRGGVNVPSDPKGSAASSGVAPVKSCPPAKTKGHRRGLDGPSRDNVSPPKVQKGDYPWPMEKRAKI
jgi:hypothetical protein